MTWSKVSGSEDVTVLDFAVSPDFPNDGTLFVATLEAGVFKSVDGGQTLIATAFTEPYVTALDISSNYALDGTVFAASYSGIHKSTDGGANWSQSITRTRHEEEWPSVFETGLWSSISFPGSSAGYVLSSSSPGDAIDFGFVGTGVALLGGKGPAYGIADILLDGSPVLSVDLYAPQAAAQQTLWQSGGLAFGEHTLRVVISNSKNPLSAGNTVTVDAFDIDR
jgi:hypothetical protein